MSASLISVYPVVPGQQTSNEANLNAEPVSSEQQSLTDTSDITKENTLQDSFQDDHVPQYHEPALQLSGEHAPMMAAQVSSTAQNTPMLSQVQKPIALLKHSKVKQMILARLSKKSNLKKKRAVKAKAKLKIPKKVGRPKKQLLNEEYELSPLFLQQPLIHGPFEEGISEQNPMQSDLIAKMPPPKQYKKRGRPKKKRGRPRKQVLLPEESVLNSDVSRPPAKKRGRPRKHVVPIPAMLEETPPLLSSPAMEHLVENTPIYPEAGPTNINLELSDNVTIGFDTSGRQSEVETENLEKSEFMSPPQQNAHNFQELEFEPTTPLQQPIQDNSPLLTSPRATVKLDTAVQHAEPPLMLDQPQILQPAAASSDQFELLHSDPLTPLIEHHSAEQQQPSSSTSSSMLPDLDHSILLLLQSDQQTEMLQHIVQQTGMLHLPDEETVNAALHQTGEASPPQPMHYEESSQMMLQQTDKQRPPMLQ